MFGKKGAPEQVEEIEMVNISITEKYLQKIEEGNTTKKSLAEKYGVKKNTIYRLQRKEKLLKHRNPVR